MKPLKASQNHDSWTIRWTYQAKRYSLTWGNVKAPLDKTKLELVGRMIVEDCLLETVDETLVRYKSWLNGETPFTHQPRQAVKYKPPLIELLKDRLDLTYNEADKALLNLLVKYGKDIKTPQQAEEFIQQQKRRGLKSSSIKRYLNTLLKLRRDLFGHIKIKVEERPSPKPFTKVEVERILDALQGSVYHDYILFLLNTGCRPSEAIGMRWKDVDLERREIHIYESLSRSRAGSSSKKRVRKTTKTSHYRCIPMNDRVYEVLKQRPVKEPDQLLFLSPTGLVIDDHNFSQNGWKETLQRLEIAHRPIYKCRATFASHCAAAGIPPATISQLLGHTSLDMLFHYLGMTEKPKLPEL